MSDLHPIEPFRRDMPTWGPRSAEFRRLLNAMAQMLVQQTILPGAGLTVNRTHAGTSLSVLPEPDWVLRAKIKAIDDDWLRCRILVGDTEQGQNIYVRKPLQLMRTDVTTGSDKTGFTWVDAQTRTDDNDDDREYGVFPEYATTGWQSEISVALQAGGTEVDGDDDVEIAFVDKNVDGRVWAFDCDA